MAAVIVSVLVGGVALAAPSQDEVDDAFSRAKQLLEEVQAARSELTTLSARLTETAQRVQEQEGEVERISSELADTQRAVDDLEAELNRVSEQLNDRAAEAYMDGPGSMADVLLGSSSMGDLSDRLAFVNVIAEQNADLANDVINARNEMEAKAAQLSELRARERDALEQIRADEAALQADMARQQALVSEIDRKEADAEHYADKLDDQRKDYLDSLVPVTPPATGGGGGGVLPPGSSVFQVCPVDAPKVVTDSFGAPRYVGGYHPHKGDDIMAAAGTPIRAPFDGYARDATNSIGGIRSSSRAQAGTCTTRTCRRSGS